jgi:DNA-binding MarR family transcriptional regulator
MTQSTAATRPAPLAAEERAFWLAFVRAVMVVPRALDAELIAAQNMSMTEYTVLMHLSEAPDRQLRMSDLANRCDLSLSGMTRVVARLMADGLVERVRCADDARGAFAVLTERGLARLEEAYPDHLASVRRTVIDHLGDADLASLTALLNRFGTGSAGADGAQCPVSCGGTEALSE